jgi:hypothetical protein
MNTLKFRLTGISDLICHNGQLADPLNEWSKKLAKVSAQRNKVEADYEEMARLEFMGGLYIKDGIPVIPGMLLKASLAGRGGAARSEKSGKQAGVGIFCETAYPLEFDGPKNPIKMWEDERFRFRIGVRVGQSTVMRTRPIIPVPWSLEGSLQYNPEFVDEDKVIHWLEVAGNSVGLGDWRPAKGGPYGRFTVEIL